MRTRAVIGHGIGGGSSVERKKGRTGVGEVQLNVRHAGIEIETEKTFFFFFVSTMEEIFLFPRGVGGQVKECKDEERERGYPGK